MKSFDRNNRRLICNLLPVVFFVAISFTSSVSAGLLSDDLTAVKHGSVLFSGSNSSYTVNGELEYAVYAPGTFNNTFGDGADPSNGNNYVYAYLINEGTSTDSIKQLTVGLSGNESPAYPGFVAGSTGVSPNMPGGLNSCKLIGGGTPFTYTSCAWNFMPTKINAGQNSKVLYFTSPYNWEMANAGLQGSIATWNGTAPSPVPEPGTLLLSLAAFGGIIAVIHARRRR